MNVSGHSKIGWVNDFVCTRVVEDGFSVDAGFVGEGTEASDIVVEGDVDFDGLCDKVFDIFELFELVFAPHVISVCCNHACHEAAKGGDTVAFTDSEHRGIDMGRAGLKGTVC